MLKKCFNKTRFVLALGLVVVLTLSYSPCTFATSSYARKIQASEVMAPIRKMFNVSIILASGVFFVMLVMGIFKMATALGDPKALQGASLTWTWAVVGFLIIIGFFALYKIIVGVLGITDADVGSPDAFFTMIENFINDLLNNFVYYHV